VETRPERFDGGHCLGGEGSFGYTYIGLSLNDNCLISVEYFFHLRYQKVAYHQTVDGILCSHKHYPLIISVCGCVYLQNSK